MNTIQLATCKSTCPRGIWSLLSFNRET